LEAVVSQELDKEKIEITKEIIENVLQRKNIVYDKAEKNITI
jgi:hypothetical protein